VQLADHFSKYHRTLPTSTQIHLLTSNVYIVPESLFILPHSSMLYTNPQSGQKYKIARRLFIHELGGNNLNEVFKKIKLLMDVSEIRLRSKRINYELFVAIPTSKAFELNQIFHEHRAIFTFQEERVFYPHLSTEAFPNFHHIFHPCEINVTGSNDPDETCQIEDDDFDFFSVKSLLEHLRVLHSSLVSSYTKLK